MGLFDFLWKGKAIAGVVTAIDQQRTLGRDLSALPMPDFVVECLRHLNMSAGNWEGRARPPNPAAVALCKAKDVPAELSAFYAECDGFESVHGDFPAAVLPLEQLRSGRDHAPSLAERLAVFWAEHGNDSDQEGLLSVLPPDDLAALAAHAADSHLPPSVLNHALALCEPRGADCVVMLLAGDAEHVARGVVLDVEGGSATRYPSFKAWLGSRASLFGSIAARTGAV